MIKKLLLLLLLTFCFQTLSAQESTRNKPLYVYLDCRSCSSSFIRSEINFVNFVREPEIATIHLIITGERTASGGRVYTLNFIGKNGLLDLQNEVNFTSYDSDTEEEVRNGLVRHVKLGFIPFLTKTEQLQNFDLAFLGEDDAQSRIPEDDKWKSWVFEVGGNAWFSGEERQNSLDLNGRTRIRRITEDWKFQLGYDYNYSREVFRNADDQGNEIEDVFIRDRHSMWSMLAYSLNDHWSVGSYLRSGSSSRDNIDFWIGATPTIEYSIYPYRDFARREVTLRYGLLTSYYDYMERTIFGQSEEVLVRQELSFNMEYTKPWGEIESRIDGRAYMHDFSKNRLNIDFEISMRVFRGFSFYVNTFYSIINDQLSLSAEGVTDKEAIANTRQQATSYQFGGRIGFEISFGSIYNNVVNTRL